MRTEIQRTKSDDAGPTVGFVLLTISVWAFIFAYGLPYMSVPETHWSIGLAHFVKWPSLLISIGYFWGYESRRN